MEIYIQQKTAPKKLTLKPRQLIGQGGEAEVYRISSTTAVKVFKSPSHPDYAHHSQAQKVAAARLDVHQQKLRQFPAPLPERVIVPQDLVSNRAGRQILGYTMALLSGAEVLWRYSQRSFRQSVSAQVMVAIFQDLHRTLTQLHRAQVVIGDFNDLNILVKDKAAYLIDADSFQFGNFPCTMFTARFVDPLHCDPKAAQLQLQSPPSPDSDWYAFTVMLMQCLLFVDPYGGLYRPESSIQKVPQALRPLHRITVFHPRVRYPKPALPLDCLPDDLLHHFYQVFDQDWRGAFPVHLLEQLQWQTCPICGLEHGRSCCPQCNQARVTPVVPPGQVKIRTVSNTTGLVLHSQVNDGQLQWVYWQDGRFWREGGQLLLEGDLIPNLRWRIQGKQTWLGCGHQLVSLATTRPHQPITIDRYGPHPQFDTTADQCFWLNQGYLWRQGNLGPQIVGEVLGGGQTQFWMGPTFGFGFYRAGQVYRAFVFDGHRARINDQVPFSGWPGQLLQATCAFSQRLCWLFLITQEQEQRRVHCRVITSQGTVVATATGKQHQTHWLTQLGLSLALGADPCPFCAVDDFLLAATDDGIVRIKLHQGQLTLDRMFPETEAHVDASCHLRAGSRGLWIIRERQIDWLQLK